MNIKFSDKTYEEFFHELYKEISKKYTLTIEKVSNTNMCLKNDMFTLFISYDMDTSWIHYTINKTKETYLISNYVNMNVESIDRDDIPKIDAIPKIIERTLIIQSRVLKRKFSNLLEGKVDWFEDYKNSDYYYPTNTPKRLPLRFDK